MTYSPKRGDIISLSRAQLAEIEILSTPLGPGPDAYSVTVPINGIPRTFTYSASFGSTLNQIAVGMRQTLFDGQTLFLIEDGLLAWSFRLRGPLGVGATTTVTPNMGVAVAQVAVSVIGEGGRQISPIRLIETESTLNKLRRFSTRDVRDGTLVDKQVVMGRELDSSALMEFDTSRILTVLELGT